MEHYTENTQIIILHNIYQVKAPSNDENNLNHQRRCKNPTSNLTNYP